VSGEPKDTQVFNVHQDNCHLFPEEIARERLGCAT
jgi:hypothetical protein